MSMKMREMNGQTVIVEPTAATAPQGSSAVNVPTNKKKQNIAKNGIKKPVATSFVLLTASFICKTLH